MWNSITTNWQYSSNELKYHSSYKTTPWQKSVLLWQLTINTIATFLPWFSLTLVNPHPLDIFSCHTTPQLPSSEREGYHTLSPRHVTPAGRVVSNCLRMQHQGRRNTLGGKRYPFPFPVVERRVHSAVIIEKENGPQMNDMSSIHGSLFIICKSPTVAYCSSSRSCVFSRTIKRRTDWPGVNCNILLKHTQVYTPSGAKGKRIKVLMSPLQPATPHGDKPISWFIFFSRKGIERLIRTESPIMCYNSKQLLQRSLVGLI